MKCRFLSVLIVAGAAMCASTVWGQDPKGVGGNESAEEMAQRQLERIDKAVSLTDDQKTQIKGFYNSLFESRPATREDGEKKFKEVEEQVKSVLTEEQKAKYEKILQSKPAPGKKRGGPRGGNKDND